MLKVHLCKQINYVLFKSYKSKAVREGRMKHSVHPGGHGTLTSVRVLFLESGLEVLPSAIDVFFNI